MSCFSLPINIALLSFFFWQLFLLLDLTWLDIDAGSFSRHHLLLLMTLLHISLVSSLEKRLWSNSLQRKHGKVLLEDQLQLWSQHLWWVLFTDSFEVDIWASPSAPPSRPPLPFIYLFNYHFLLGEGGSWVSNLEEALLGQFGFGFSFIIWSYYTDFTFPSTYVITKSDLLNLYIL